MLYTLVYKMKGKISNKEHLRLYIYWREPVGLLQARGTPSGMR